MIDATLEEIAPQDHDHLFRSVGQSYAISTMNLDSTLMEAILHVHTSSILLSSEATSVVLAISLLS